MTPNAWLTLFLQLTNMAGMKEPSKNFVRPKYSAREFIRIIQVRPSEVLRRLLGNMCQVVAVESYINYQTLPNIGHWRMETRQRFLVSKA